MKQRFLPVLVCLLSSFQLSRADLVLDEYSSSRPLKIMAIGDSITDDCAVNGAWRLHLQPMLETNGYHFVFVGRQKSAATPGFTQLNHEGHCGSVVGPPGVFAVHGYATSNSFLLNIIADALAVANNRPDLVLLLIGANDMGRGRNPHQVVTNDLSQLVDLIFSSAPNANIIIGKITSLQNATLSPYGSYATNVPIFNTSLQHFVNQRRELGQNVFVADMFTAVDYSTMFMPDHVHPNPLGLRAIAAEWFGRIQAITTRTNSLKRLLVSGGGRWKFHDLGQDLGAAWVQPHYDDGSWDIGTARFGYGDPAVVTLVSFGSEPTNKFLTAYFRKWFEVPMHVAITNLELRLARGNGAVLYLNGAELFRTNLPSGPISYTNLAVFPMNRYSAHLYYPANLPVAALPSGPNLLAVEMHQFTLAYPLLAFDLELFGAGHRLEVPSLAIRQIGQAVRLEWPIANSAGLSLYTASNLESPVWVRLTTPLYTNGSHLVSTQYPDVSSRYFRLQRN